MPAPVRARDHERSSERFDTVGEADEARAGTYRRAAAAVVRHLGHHQPVRDGHADGDAVRVRVLRRVGERLRGDVVDGDAHRLGQIAGGDVQVDGHERRLGERYERGVEPAVV